MSDASIRVAAPDEADAITEMMTLAFAGDPGMRAVFPSAGRYLSSFPLFADAYCGRAYENGTAFVVDDLSGAAMWLPPGVHQDGAAVAKVAAKDPPREMLEGGFQTFARVAEFHPDEPYWYLAMLAVDPKRHGRGLGSRLLETTLRRVDEDHKPAFLETSRPSNVPLYERFGFEVLAELSREGADWTMIPMLRRAR